MSIQTHVRRTIQLQPVRQQAEVVPRHLTGVTPDLATLPVHVIMATRTHTQNRLLQEEPTIRQAIIITTVAPQAGTTHTIVHPQEAAQLIAAQVEIQVVAPAQTEAHRTAVQAEALAVAVLLEVHILPEVHHQEAHQVALHQEDHQAHRVHLVEEEDNFKKLKT